MLIQNMKITDVRPYERNPRRNNKAVDAVAASIKEFGWRAPIVVDTDMVIVCGHTRLKAAKKLGLKEVPVHIAEDLTPEQIKAFRLADNKVGELASWNGTQLELELGDLTKVNFDMKPFSFEPINFNVDTGKVEKGEEFETHRAKTWKHDNFDIFLEIPPDEVTELGFPILKPVDVKPQVSEIQQFSEIMAAPEYNLGVHFFIDDYRFERCWQNPERYTKYLEKHPFVIQPDFSTYTDMPVIMQMWNKYRNHLLAWYWQNMCGLDVVPNVMFSDENSWHWVFDGMPQNSTICISNVGVMQNKEWREAFAVGLTEMIKRLSPTRILFYGTIPADYDFGDIEVMAFKSRSFRKKIGTENG